MDATMVDTDTFRDVAVALREVAAAIREHLANESDRMTELLAEIARKLDPSRSPPRRRHTRTRGGASGFR